MSCPGCGDDAALTTTTATLPRIAASFSVDVVDRGSIIFLALDPEASASRAGAGALLPSHAVAVVVAPRYRNPCAWAGV